MKLLDCPKSMTYGPCGGVRSDSSCEVDGRPCPFAVRSTESWAGDVRDVRTVDVPRVIVDHRPSDDEQRDDDALSVFRDLGVTVLLGDHLDDPHSFDRVGAVRRTTRTGVSTIATITGRGRTPGEQHRLIDDYLDAGVAAVLCVTGDHPAARFSDDAEVAFTSEGTRLAAEARDRGAVVAVVENPASPPRGHRSARLRTKQDAGADFAVLNHGGSVRDATAFAQSVRAAGVSLPLVAPVAVMTDRGSIDALTQFPGVELDAADIARIIDAKDSTQAGIAIATAHARTLLDTEEVGGVNLSGVATFAGPVARAEVMATIAEALIDG